MFDMTDTLLLREIINGVIMVFTGVMSVLFVKYVWRQWRCRGYKCLDESGKAAISWSFISLGEFIRSSIVLKILHYDVGEATYLTQIVPLNVSLALIIIGSLCAIRVFSPAKCGHWSWIISLLAACIFAAAIATF